MVKVRKKHSTAVLRNPKKSNHIKQFTFSVHPSVCLIFLKMEFGRRAQVQMVLM